MELAQGGTLFLDEIAGGFDASLASEIAPCASGRVALHEDR